MGTTASCIHIYGDFAAENIPFEFRSFSPGWYTCVEDFSGKLPDYAYKAAKFIAAKIENPVVYFSVRDSEAVFFEVLSGRKILARYSDDSLDANKKIYDIPALLGCGECGKRRLSAIFSCADTELKISLLEEYFGLALLYFPEAEEAELAREKSDVLYREYVMGEKLLTGKRAPFKAEHVREYKGKIFLSEFGSRAMIEEHYYLLGFSEERESELWPVHFAGGELKAVDPSKETVRLGLERDRTNEKYFSAEYGTTVKVTFKDTCPEAYRGKTMPMPSGFYPAGFLGTGELIIAAGNKVYVADSTLKIISKLTVKGDVEELWCDHILTVVGNSFFYYGYEPNASIHIYKIEKREK